MDTHPVLVLNTSLDSDIGLHKITLTIKLRNYPHITYD